ncbi:hypothetical protein JCM10207_001754 [Rhodosporidiobolus poonsookiae]
MPTLTTKHTGGTPHTRAAALLSTALSSLDPSHPSYAALSEAHTLVAGEEDYLEKHSSGLIVPSTHGVGADEVREVWEELLKATEETDWKALKDEGKTKWELGAGMCSGEFEAVVLQNLALMAKSTSVLEIGVFTGTATLALALLPSVTHITALDLEPYLPVFVAPYWTRAGVASKIDFRIAPALDSLRALSDEKHSGFDFVFIDADKPGYESYVRAILELGLLREGGVILADNTLYKGYPWSPPSPAGLRTSSSAAYGEKNGTNNQSASEATQGIQGFNTFVHSHPELETCVLPARDGITVIRRKI